jgi:hypothetical protein
MRSSRSGCATPPASRWKAGSAFWKTEDFKSDPILVKEFDVTGSLVLPGPFSVTFKHTSSALGTYISRAALVASPKDKPGERLELCVDEHNSSVPNPRDGKNTYHLRLDTIDPKRHLLCRRQTAEPLFAEFRQEQLQRGCAVSMRAQTVLAGARDECRAVSRSARQITHTSGHGGSGAPAC